MSVFSLGNQYKFKDILIKNPLKVPSYNYKPHYNQSTGFSVYKKNILHSNQNSQRKMIPSKYLHSKNKSFLIFNDDTKYHTYRLFSSKRLSKKFQSPERKERSIIKERSHNQSESKSKEEYYNLPDVFNNKKNNSFALENNNIKLYKFSNKKTKNKKSFDFSGNYNKEHSYLKIVDITKSHLNSNGNNSNKKLSHNKSMGFNVKPSILLKNSKKEKSQEKKKPIIFKVKFFPNSKEHVPKSQYNSSLIKFSCHTIPGLNMSGCVKTNQDNYFTNKNIFELTNYSVFGIFDGHGANGHFVSKCISDFFYKHFSKRDIYKNINTLEKLNEKKIYEIISNPSFPMQICSLADEKLKKEKIDANLSGSTGIIIIHIEDKIICYNIGDSRAIYIDSNYEVFQISRDHKPNIPEEQKRINARGGRVARLPEFPNFGPFRVWVKNEEYPGLAMSRSFGDFIAKNVGVINKAECFELDVVEKKIKAVILGSDGLFEFLTNKQIATIATPFIRNNDCVGANKKLVDEAYKAWTSDGVICDDITVIVLIFNIDN